MPVRIVCMYECMYVLYDCTYTGTYCMNERMHHQRIVCMYVWMYVLYERTYACVYVSCQAATSIVNKTHAPATCSKTATSPFCK